MSELTLLDNIRIVEPTPKKTIVEQCRSEFSRAFWAENIETGERHDINCRSWRCPRHRQQWGRKWGAIIGDQLSKADPRHLLLVNLTTAEMTYWPQIEAALRFFMRRMRKVFGALEYVKVVEYNKKHTQPHFHLIIRFETYRLPPRPDNLAPTVSFPVQTHDTINILWREAMNFAFADAKKETIITWCQPPRGDGKAASNYAVGYVTGKNKDEEPDTTWRGRKLTYSRGFFTATTARDIWANLLTQWFGEKPLEKPIYCWIPKDDYCEQYGIPFHLYSDIVKERLLMLRFWLRNAEFPAKPIENIKQLFYDIMSNGQECFT